jgi:mannosyltransferase OCH1-like enzyme
MGVLVAESRSEYMLWTDDTSREFIAEHYPSQLQMFDSYTYPIQRADSIRYFVLHHFGGIYMDLDIGCRRRMDPLLQGDWEVILPITKPVGVSNDLIFSSKGSDFMDDTVHGLSAFDHQYLTNYPTVMFSTGYVVYSNIGFIADFPDPCFCRRNMPSTLPHTH